MGRKSPPSTRRKLPERGAPSPAASGPGDGLLRPLIHSMSLFRKDVAMTHARHQKDFDLNHLLHPASAFRTPMDVVADPDMTVQEKRAILSSWASDACAVEAEPELRSPPSGPVVRFDDIMEALKTLDGQAASTPRYQKLISRARRIRDLYRAD